MPALSELSLGRKNGLVRPIGHIKAYRCESRNPRARADFERARARNAILSAGPGSSCRRARPVRTKPRPEEWLSPPDRAHQGLSMCIEKTPCARRFRARARNAILSAAPGSSCRRSRPVRTKPRPEEWLSSPDRAHQDLSMCIEKPPRAPYFRARACQMCDFMLRSR